MQTGTKAQRLVNVEEVSTTSICTGIYSLTEAMDRKQNETKKI